LKPLLVWIVESNNFLLFFTQSFADDEMMNTKAHYKTREREGETDK
jgi:hypothetical protein